MFIMMISYLLEVIYIFLRVKLLGSCGGVQDRVY